MHCIHCESLPEFNLFSRCDHLHNPSKCLLCKLLELMSKFRASISIIVNAISSPHNRWKHCVWWFQDKCNDYSNCENCNLHKMKQQVVEKFETITEYKINKSVTYLVHCIGE